MSRNRDKTWAKKKGDKKPKRKRRKHNKTLSHKKVKGVNRKKKLCQKGNKIEEITCLVWLQSYP
jgi:hypothetical protein